VLKFLFQSFSSYNPFFRYSQASEEARTASYFLLILFSD
jgi:hypothetical protein